MGEGIEPSHHSELIDLIGKSILSAQSMMYEFVIMEDTPSTCVDVDIEVSITKLSAVKYGDDVYKVEIMLQDDDGKAIKFNAYSSLCRNVILALYRNNMIGKYIIHTRMSYLFTVRSSLPIGVKTALYDLQTISWTLGVILDMLDEEGDTETFNKIFENMSNEQFQVIKGVLYQSIMYEYTPPKNNIFITPAHIYSDQFKAIFLHWCNKFAMDNKDEVISL
jgi:hypothetical protein